MARMNFASGGTSSAAIWQASISSRLNSAPATSKVSSPHISERAVGEPSRLATKRATASGDSAGLS